MALLGIVIGTQGKQKNQVCSGGAKPFGRGHPRVRGLRHIFILPLLWAALGALPARANLCMAAIATAGSPLQWLFQAGSSVGRNVTFDHGVTVEERVTWFGFKRRVVVSYPDGTVVDFNRTDRTLSQLRGYLFYPEHFLSDVALKGLSVLDFGCGDGSVVTALRSAGIDAHGLDIYLRPWQRTLPYMTMADGAYTPYRSEKFDVVMSTWSAVAYLMYEAYRRHGVSPEAKRRARTAAATVLGEMIRITKKGGVIRLSPMLHQRVNGAVEYPELQSILDEYYPNVRIKSRPDASWLAQYTYYETPSPTMEGHRVDAEVWVELERVR